MPHTAARHPSPKWRCRLSALLLLLILAACETPEPPPEPVVAAQPPVAAPARTPPRAEPQTLDARWQFFAEEGVCRASIVAGTLSMTVRVEGGSVHVALPARPAPRRPGALGFVGDLGTWTQRLRPSPDGLVASEPLDEAAVSRLLALLGGGTATLPAGTRLRLPSGGPMGRSWFGCVRTQLVL